MRKFIALFLLLIVIACEKPQSNLDTYYDLEDRLNQQVVKLTAEKAGLKKTIIVGEEKETKTFEPDSLGWSEHLDILADFTPADPAFVGAFDITEVDGKTQYKVKPGLKVPLRSFEVGNVGKGEIISAVLENDKTVFSDYKKMTLRFRDDQLAFFKVEGFQKMMLKDTVFYTIEGIVTK
ncbi:MAG: hypothetical protein ABJ004_03695 [Cyclobacteriaceae bacterium]